VEFILNDKLFKTVSFNIKNPDDEKILNSVKRKNFTKYVKKLILQDINHGGKAKQKIEFEETIPEKMSAADRLKALKQKRRP
jgi:hypothetical protein